MSDTSHFVSLYHVRRGLWDVRHVNYTNKLKRQQAISEIAEETNLTEQQVIKKINYLRSYFSKEHSKVCMSINSGAVEDDVYTPNWPYYKELSFLIDIVNPRSVVTEVIEEQDHKPPLAKRRNVIENDQMNLPMFTTSPPPPPLPLTTSATSEDECDIFGKMIASEMRKLNSRAQTRVKYEIHGLIYQELLNQEGNVM